MLIRWTKPAVDDLSHVCGYTEEHFGAAQAHRAAVAIYDAADSLQTMPHRGRPGRKPGTLEMVVSRFPFIVIYRVGQEAVEIVRVLHGAQQWP
jgi:toxin ParE1/3/4